jgi:hypothetical protein
VVFDGKLPSNAAGLDRDKDAGSTWRRAGSELRIYETTAVDFRVCLRVSSQPNEPCVHNPETDIPSLRCVWTGI